MKEIWRKVKGYEELLIVSNIGNVKRLGWTNKAGNYVLEKDKAISTHHTGYRYIVINFEGKQKFLLVHRLVAEAFIPNPDNLSEVNHQDLNKSNNSINNLEWCSRQENVDHAVAKGARKVNTNKPNINKTRVNKPKSYAPTNPGGIPKKPIVAIDAEGNETTYESANACARAIDGFSTNIAKCLKGKLRTYKGYTFKYV